VLLENIGEAPEAVNKSGASIGFVDKVETLINEYRARSKSTI